jgi:O-antigen/teichoic acid export membrane protein
LIIAGAAPEEEAGHLMLAMQVMLMPLVLLGSSIGQVYLSKAPEKHRNGQLRHFTISTIWRLFILGGFPIAVTGLAGPWTFPIVFGFEWARSGEIAALMVPWMLLQFLAVPVSMSLHVINRTILALILQMAGMLVRVGCVFAALQLNKSLVTAMVSGAAVFYLVMLCCIILVLRKDDHAVELPK